MKRVWRDYGLSITLAVLFLVSWALQTWTGWIEFVAEQAAHGQPPKPSVRTATSGPGPRRPSRTGSPSSCRCSCSSSSRRSSSTARATSRPTPTTTQRPPSGGSRRRSIDLEQQRAMPMTARKDETQLTRGGHLRGASALGEADRPLGLSLRRPRRRAPVHGRLDRRPRRVGLRTAPLSG